MDGFYYNDEPYFYVINAIGIIIELIDRKSNVVAKYSYDAWGNCKVLDSSGKEITDPENIGNINPFRYRGYYYDVETGLYFLSSRYYNPLWGRFISPDSIDYLDPESVNGFNLYAYCGNDPVNCVDPSGHAWETIFDIGFAIWSLVDFIKDPTWENAGWLALDAFAVAVPFLPGGSKVITKADDIADAVGFVNKYDEVVVLGQSMGKRVILTQMKLVQHSIKD